MKIHHTAISVKDINRSVDWYITHFGFVETHRVKRKDKEIVLLNLDRTNLEIFQTDNNFSAPEYEGNLTKDLQHIGVRHFAILVEDLEDKLKSLRADDVEIISDTTPAFYGGQYCFVKDPDGILVELLCTEKTDR